MLKSLQNETVYKYRRKVSVERGVFRRHLYTAALSLKSSIPHGINKVSFLHLPPPSYDSLKEALGYSTLFFSPALILQRDIQK